MAGEVAADALVIGLVAAEAVVLAATETCLDFLFQWRQRRVKVGSGGVEEWPSSSQERCVALRHLK